MDFLGLSIVRTSELDALRAAAASSASLRGQIAAAESVSEKRIDDMKRFTDWLVRGFGRPQVYGSFPDEPVTAEEMEIHEKPSERRLQYDLEREFFEATADQQLAELQRNQQ